MMPDSLSSLWNAAISYVQRRQYDQLPQDGATMLFTIGLGLWSVYGILLIFYRLFLSPISKFPGPRLAAATEWYEFYHTIWRNGQWGSEISKMHQKYGPIVRISPWELSIRDASFYNKLYVTGNQRKTDMWPRGREGNGFEDSHHLTVPHDTHRQRRKPLETFFSRQGISRVEDIIFNESKALDKRLESLKGTDTVVHIDHAFTALTGDIIGHVACGAQPGLADDSEFSPAWHDLMIKTVLVAPIFRCFTWLNTIIQTMPASVMARLYPEGISSKLVGEAGKSYIENIRRRLISDKASIDDVQHSVFHHLLTSDIPESEKTTKRLQAESMIFLIAGTVTSAHTLTMIVYHVLRNPEIERRLRDDLKDVMSTYPASNPAWAEIEKVAYLQGCIKESLRLNGLIGNLARVSPDVDIQYKQWIIPKKTPVGMSIHYMHTDPAVWSDPFAFKPERWIGNYDPLQDRNFVPFTKGSRGCLGINLAMAELCIMTALMFRPDAPRLSLYQTEESDIKFVRDFVMGFPEKGSRGVRVLVR